jgi:hypothetical protein
MKQRLLISLYIKRWVSKKEKERFNLAAKRHPARCRDGCQRHAPTSALRHWVALVKGKHCTAGPLGPIKTHLICATRSSKQTNSDHVTIAMWSDASTLRLVHADAAVLQTPFARRIVALQYSSFGRNARTKREKESERRSLDRSC